MNISVTRNPQFAIRVVSEHLGEFTVRDTHDSVLSIDVQRQLGDTCGSFHITMVPRPIAEVPSRAWWDALSPMDYVEIFMWVPPGQPTVPVMRGFIDTVADSANYGARGQRIISVLGRDYGKLLLVTRLYYPTEGIQQVALFKKWSDGHKKLFGDLHGLPPERPPMGENDTSSGPNFAPTDVQKLIFEEFYQPQETEILQTFEGAIRPPAMELSLEAANDPWEQKLRAFNPAFFHKGLAPWTDLWTLMYAYQHRPWREIFISETQDKSQLVYRPAPWLTKEGEWVQGDPGSSMQTWDINGEQIVSASYTRSDAQVLNYFMSFPEAFALLGQMAKVTGDMEGVFDQPLVKNPSLVGYEDNEKILALNSGNTGGRDTLTSRYQRFGFRIAEFPTPYLSMERGLREAQVRLKMADIKEQGVEGTKRLRQAFDHNHVLEDGRMTIRGDSRIQVGHYIKLLNQKGARSYVETVRHEFKVGTQPNDGHFLTHLGLSRGRRHLVKHYGLPE